MMVFPSKPTKKHEIFFWSANPTPLAGQIGPRPGIKPQFPTFWRVDKKHLINFNIVDLKDLIGEYKKIHLSLKLTVRTWNTRVGRWVPWKASWQVRAVSFGENIFFGTKTTFTNEHFCSREEQEENPSISQFLIKSFWLFFHWFCPDFAFEPSVCLGCGPLPVIVPCHVKILMVTTTGKGATPKVCHIITALTSCPQLLILSNLQPSKQDAYMSCLSNNILSKSSFGWWFQCLRKICSSKWTPSPNRGWTSKLVGGFNPSEKYSSNWTSSQASAKTTKKIFDTTT